MDNRELLDYIFRGGGIQVITSLPESVHRQFHAEDVDAAYDYVVEQGKISNVYLNPNPRRDDLPPGVRGGDDDVRKVIAFVTDVDVLGPAHKEQNLPPTKQDAIDILNGLSIPPSVIVDSGYGIYGYHLFEIPIDTTDDEVRTHVSALYKGFGKYIASVFAEKGWKVDPVFNLSHMFRAPGSLNHKLDSEKPECRVIADNGIFYSLEDFEVFYEEPVVEHTAFEVDERVVGSAERMLEGCAYIRKLVENPNEVTEPEWKAALSGISLAKDGVEKAHEWSALYAGYSFDETEAKIRQCYLL
jgi:putative DNA primase/helicase